MKKKIAIVGTGAGRTGSSALMGLLKLAGLNVGGKTSGFKKTSKNNPKGFFEIKNFIQFMQKDVPGYLWHPPKSIINVQEVAKEKRRIFNTLLQDEFKQVFPIAIKSYRYLVLPFFELTKNKYDIKIVFLKRAFDKQLKSIIRGRLGVKCYETPKACEKMLIEWLSFEQLIKKHYNNIFDFLDVSFEDLMGEPVKTFTLIASFLGIPTLPKSTVLNWIDPKLVNRKAYK